MVSKAANRIVLDPLSAQSVDDLKRMGSFRAVRQRLQEQVGPNVRLRVRGWNDLARAVGDLRASRVDSELKRGSFFVSPAAEYIFALLYLEGDAKERILATSIRHYRDRDLAKAWRDTIAKLIHPDRCLHPDATKAMAALSRIYRRMTAR